MASCPRSQRAMSMSEKHSMVSSPSTTCCGLSTVLLSSQAVVCMCAVLSITYMQAGRETRCRFLGHFFLMHMLLVLTLHVLSYEFVFHLLRVYVCVPECMHVYINHMYYAHSTFCRPLLCVSCDPIVPDTNTSLSLSACCFTSPLCTSLVGSKYHVS